jgi:ribonucleoside-triphosphate reductase
MQVIKKDGTLETYNEQKIINACSLAANRALINFSDEDYTTICNKVLNVIDEENYFEEEFQEDIIPVSDMHVIVEKVLMELYPSVGESYRQYRNYKQDFVKMLNEVYTKEQEQRYIGDVSNANTDSTMVSTQRSLSYGLLSKELYKHFFLTKEEMQASNDGYIYIHDMKDRRDGINCCLFNMSNVLNNGFEMGNVWYNEPKTLDVAFDVIGDVTFGASAQQYGGFTIPQIDKILAPYAEKSYQKYKKEFYEIKGLIEDVDGVYLDCMSNITFDSQADKYATEKVRKEFEQGFQGWEYKFNTVGSSRGDYPFIAISFGIGTSKWETMASEMALKVRMNGQGKEGFKRPVLFPKLTFLYDDNLHGEGKEFEWLFDLACQCSSKTMYPDFLSLSGEGYIPSMYKKYGKVVSLMGCRASLSPWYERGGMHPADEDDVPVFEGRFNLGAISLHLPMILAKARQENKDFYEVLDYYLELIRNLHKRTYAFLGEKKASTNPLGFTQGGFYGGTLNPEDKIKSILPPMTMSFGITALNELQELYNGKSLVEDGAFALEVMKYINAYTERIKEEDHILYAIYGTPAESLCGLQIEQFRKKYGIIEGVSDRAYVSNSFHCGVWEEITPIQKQDLEGRFWDLFNGGKIQYCRYPVDYNFEAQKTLIRRAMQKGFYEGCNLALSYCEDCGYEQLEMNECPRCHSKNITQIDRMNGYIGYTKIHGKTRYNSAKVIEIKERKSM